MLFCVLYSFLAILEVNFGNIFELSNYYQVFVIIMPRKKVDKSDEKDSSSNKKLGRPSGNI